MRKTRQGGGLADHQQFGIWVLIKELTASRQGNHRPVVASHAIDS
jgi:hypothetical protein